MDGVAVFKKLGGLLWAVFVGWLLTNRQVFGGLARAVLAAFGGWLVSEGFIGEGDTEAVAANATSVAGAAAVIVTAVWSWVSKARAAGQKKEGAE